MSAASATADLWAALVTTSTALFDADDIVVTHGPAGIDDFSDILEWLAVAVDEGDSPMSPMRRRHFAFEARGRITTGQGGGAEIQQTVTDRALAYLASVSDYLQDSGNSSSTQITLGNVVDWARVASFEATTEEDDIEVGRTAYIEFIVTGQLTA